MHPCHWLLVAGTLLIAAACGGSDRHGETPVGTSPSTGGSGPGDTGSDGALPPPSTPNSEPNDLPPSSSPATAPSTSLNETGPAR